MNNLVEQMIEIVESNAVDNKAVIPDVETWAIAWREEVSKLQTNDWIEIWAEWVSKSHNFDASKFLEYLKDNYEPPTKKS